MPRQNTAPPTYSKVLIKASGLVMQRHHADAGEMARSHPNEFELVRDDRPTINEMLARLSTESLVQHARAHNVPAFHATPHPDLVAQLAREVENGRLPLPQEIR